MTQPRNKQINDPQVKYTYFDIDQQMTGQTSYQISGAAYTSMLAASVTGDPTGASANSGAFLIGSGLEPFSGGGLGTGSQLTVQMPSANGGNPMTVTFQTGDFVTLGGGTVTTATRVAARINSDLAAYGVGSVASSNAGYLQVRSGDGAGQFTTGADEYVKLDDVTAGILQALGLGALVTTTVYGTDGPSAGIVTKNPSNEGGQVTFRTRRGLPVLTYNSGIHNYFRTGVLPSLPGGAPIYGKIVHDAATPAFNIDFFAKVPYRATSLTSESDFSSLDPTDTLRISMNIGTVAFSVIDVTFNPAPTTVQETIDLINEAWYTASDVNEGGGRHASVIAGVPEPYSFSDSEYLYFKVDGSTPAITVTIPAGTYSAADLATVIQAAITAQDPGSATCSSVVVDTRNHLEIQSAVTGGSSYINVFANTDSVLSVLGISNGVWMGTDIAFLDGGAEIRIVNPAWYTQGVSDSSLSLSDISGTPIAKMGLSSTSTNTGFEEKSVEMFNVNNDDLTMIFPEVMEFGDVPDDIDMQLESFNIPDGIVDKLQVVSPDRVKGGARNEGLYPTLGTDGRLLPQHVPAFLDNVNANTVTIGSYTVGSNRLYPRIILPHKVETDDLGATLMTESPIMPPLSDGHSYRSYVQSLSDGSMTTLSTLNARLSGTGVVPDSAAHASLAVMFGEESWGIFEKAAGTGTFTAWDSVLTLNRDPGGVVVWRLDTNGTALSGNTGPLSFTDVNYSATLSEVFPMSGSVTSAGDATIRVGNLAIDSYDPDYSLFRDLNARAYVSCGDGIDTFGDFNGATALDDAVAHLGLRPAHIFMKAGTYTPANHIELSPDVMIEGESRDTTFINTPTAGANTLVMDAGAVRLKNLTIHGATGNYSLAAYSGTSDVLVEDCKLTNVGLENVSGMCQFKRTVLGPVGSGNNHCVSILGAMANSVQFEECEFDCGLSYNSNPVLVKSPAAGRSIVEGLHFSKCEFNLTYSILSGSYLGGNTGVVDLDPNGLDARSGTVGTVVNDIMFEDCVVSALNSNIAGRANVLLHLIPTANGNAPAGSTSPWLQVNSVSFLQTDFRWLPTPASTVNPFSVAFSTDTGTVVNVHGCTFNKDVTTTYSSSGVHGSATADMSYGFPVGITDSLWGLFSISADCVSVKDTTFRRLIHTSTSGDLNLYYGKTLEVENVTCKDYDLANSSGTSPNSRIRFASNLFIRGTGSVKNLFLYGKTASTSNQWASVAFIYNDAVGVKFDNVTVIDFQTSASISSVVGIKLAELSAFSRVNAFHVSGCDLGRGIFANPTVGYPIHITNCYIDDTTYQGIHLLLPNGSSAYHIEDCTVNDTDWAGIDVEYYSGSQDLTITGNRVYANAIADILLSQVFGSPDSYPTCTITGNYCRGQGTIKASKFSSGSDAQLASAPTVRGTTACYIGLETSLTGATFTYASGQPLLWNRGVLTTP